MYQAVFVLVDILLLCLCRANSEIDICLYRCDPFYTAISHLKASFAMLKADPEPFFQCAQDVVNKMLDRVRGECLTPHL